MGNSIVPSDVPLFTKVSGWIIALICAGIGVYILTQAPAAGIARLPILFWGWGWIQTGAVVGILLNAVGDICEMLHPQEDSKVSEAHP
jgi:hypothetical protein